ncbi:hypothetical protein ACSYAD_29145 [Acaryochloris marina NIES-2412]|uniref:hypothetical protein n=1 Tax=Acaryochloris marina TaxID=155978 RepID=UPI004059B7B8
MDKKTGIVLDAFAKAYNQLNTTEIAHTVDDIGIDAFIERCARYAATTGAATSVGGAFTMVAGLPIDIINVISQQFRVTMGVIYYKKRILRPSFEEFMKIVGISVGVEIGATVGKAILIAIANKILARLAISMGGKTIPLPFVGAAIVATANYGFIKAIGHTVKQLDMSIIDPPTSQGAAVPA